MDQAEERFQRLQARGAKSGLSMGGFDLPRKRGDVPLDSLDGLLATFGHQVRIHHADRTDEAIRLLDETIGAGSSQDLLYPLEGRSCLGIAVQLHPVQLEPLKGLAELLPGGLLVRVKMLQVAELIGQIQQGVLPVVELLDELVAAVTGQKFFNEDQSIGHLVLAGIVAGVGQRFVAVQRGLPVFELVLQEVEQGVFAVRPHLEVAAQVVNGLLITLFLFQGWGLLTDVVAAKNRLDFLQA